MERVCSAVHQQEFDTLFSVSDEAFILLFINNYAERWNAEMALKKDLVRYPVFVQTQTFLDKNHLLVVVWNRESTV